MFVRAECDCLFVGEGCVVFLGVERMTGTGRTKALMYVQIKPYVCERHIPSAVVLLV